MIVYSGTKSDFLTSVEADSIAIEIEDNIYKKMHRRTAQNEFRSWENSLEYMYKVLNDNTIPENSGIAIEYNIPQTSKRVDFIISGYNEKKDPMNDLPDDCLVDYDFRLIDLFEEMEKRQAKLDDLIWTEYERIKEQVGHRPSRLELFTFMDDDIYQNVINKSSKNLFKHYLKFLEEHNELTLPEQQFCKTIGREFIELVETTSMSKVYKMPVLKAFYNNGDCLYTVNDEQLLNSWKDFFATGRNWRDLPQVSSYQDYQNMTDKKHLDNIYKNPVNFLVKSGEGFFVLNDDKTVSLKAELRKVIINPVFAEQFCDVIDYRTMDYYSRRLAEGEEHF